MLTLPPHTVTPHINLQDTQIGKAFYKKDTVNGYFHFNVYSEFTKEIHNVHKYTFQHCDPCKVNAGEYKNTFMSTLQDHKNFYSSRYENVKFSQGNIVYNSSGNVKVVGYFIAIYDTNIIALETRTLEGECLYFKGENLSLNKNNQLYEPHIKPSAKEKYSFTSPKENHHGAWKISKQELEEIKELLIEGKMKQKDIAEMYHCDASKISRIKKSLKS